MIEGNEEAGNESSFSMVRSLGSAEIRGVAEFLGARRDEGRSRGGSGR